MNWSNPIFIISGSVGLAFFLAYVVVSIWPPKEINDLYGYRSTRSKKSQEAWDFAQQYANRLMLLISALNLLLGIAGTLLTISTVLSVVVSLTFMSITLLWLFWKSERALKQKFGE